MTRSHRIVAVLATVLLIRPAPASEPPSKPLHWPVYRGDAARSNRAAGGPPNVKAQWRQSMIFEWRNTAIVRVRIRRAERESLQIIPAFSPIALTALDKKGANKSLLVYRSYFGVMAVDIRNGQFAWVSPSNWSLQRMLNASDSRRDAADKSLDESEKQHPRVLFENSTTGTLSTAGLFVYIVDDFTVPPPRIARKRQDDRRNSPNHTPAPKYGISQSKISYSDLIFNRVLHNVPYDVRYDPETEDAIRHNRLYALDLSRTGALSWSLGEEEKDPLRDHSFLGPPLPLDGLLYILIQKEQEVSLLCIDPQAGKQRRIQPRFVFQKPLLGTATSLLEDPIRRTQAAHLAYADGILVCPTNAGIVFGIDLATRWHAWVYPYRKKPPAGGWNCWKVTAPIIADGKVVFTPPDDPSIHCLNLSDGAVQWSRKKSDDDVYLGGVYGGKVLIVGAENVRALNLANGETLWTQETGLPSGQGIAAGNVYYLPLQRGAQSKEPEICVLDLNTGKVIDHLKTHPRTPNGEDFDVPGNLIFVEGKLISQSRWEVVAYPLRGGQ